MIVFEDEKTVTERAIEDYYEERILRNEKLEKARKQTEMVLERRQRIERRRMRMVTSLQLYKMLTADSSSKDSTESLSLIDFYMSASDETEDDGETDTEDDIERFSFWLKTVMSCLSGKVTDKIETLK